MDWLFSFDFFPSLLSRLTASFLPILALVDLKYENLMFTDASKDAEVKIIDFGLSKKYAADSFLHDTVGTV